MEREKAALSQLLAVGLGSMNTYRGFHVTMLPMVIGAIGNILNLCKYLAKVPLAEDKPIVLREMQKEVHMGGQRIWKHHLRGIYRW